MDTSGTIVHSWHDGLNQEWTRAWAYPDGSVLRVSSGPARLVKLDRNSRVIWTYGDDGFKAHHDFQVQPDGRIYVLMRGLSVFPWLPGRVIQDDVICILEPGFFSRGAGAQQLLPNGNILVTESTRGRIFEITRDGRVVWEYLNPRRIYDGKTIVRTPRAYRVPYDYFTGEFGRSLAAARQ